MADQPDFGKLSQADVDEDSAVIQEGDGANDLLEVYETGRVTVVGFGGRDVPDDASVAAYRSQLYELVERHDAETLAFDLTGVRLMPSGLLGMLASLHRRGLKIQLFNASEDVRDVLHTTRLNQLFEVCDVDVAER